MEISIPRLEAVALVEALLMERQQAGKELAVIGVRETPVGWIVAWHSARFKNNPTPDGEDGRIYQIPGETFRTEDWQAMFREQFKGIRRPDELVESTRAALQEGGQIAAVRHLRRCAPALNLSQAREYALAVQREGYPPDDLLSLTREPEICPRFPILRVAGPAI
ncbi:hypothetical protein ACFP3U_23660 [Kitasatospora misakiensis]|uniref:Immunity protein 35 domain-containing protein n=1 Tax=Kitasatospora misakiensis TaxID=67330 RepID=A0ABW0X686_9ACTN